MQTIMCVTESVCSDWSTWFCSMKVSFLFCCQWGSYFIFVSLFEGICTGWSGEHCGRMLWNHSRPHQVLYLLCRPLACLSIGPSIPLSFSSSLSCPSVCMSHPLSHFPSRERESGRSGKENGTGHKRNKFHFLSLPLPLSLHLPPSFPPSLSLSLSPSLHHSSTTTPIPHPSIWIFLVFMLLLLLLLCFVLVVVCVWFIKLI